MKSGERKSKPGILSAVSARTCKAVNAAGSWAKQAVLVKVVGHRA
jgi:hypothetical protein